MIEHLRGRQKALEALGWTGRERRNGLRLSVSTAASLS